MIEYLTLPSARPRVYLDARLRPNRSFSPKAFARLMRMVVAVSVGASLVLYLSGAWPVLGFLGLDVLLIYLAFRASNAHHARHFDQITLSEEGLRIARQRGAAKESLLLEPAFLQVRVENDAIHVPLRLYSHGHYHEIGGCLGVGEKEAFAQELRQALGLRRREMAQTL